VGIILDLQTGGPKFFTKHKLVTYFVNFIAIKYQLVKIIEVVHYIIAPRYAYLLI
jgi:hypothetical protein